MSNRQPQFKDTQLFGWDSEPATERETTFFHNDCISAAEARRNTRRAKGALRLVIGIIVVVGIGFAGLLQLAHVVGH